MFGKPSARDPKPITKEQVATLLHLCYCNAKDLYDEATLLRRNGKYARAFFLCTLALEELAKVPITLNALFIPKEDKEAWVGFWNAFNSHKVKQGAARAYGQGIMKQLDKDRWAKYYRDQIPEDVPLNEAKLASMYVDCYDGVALRPNKIFAQDEGYVSSIFTVVEKRLEAYGTFHATMDRSIDFVRAAMEFPLEVSVDGKNLNATIPEEFRKRTKGR